MDLASYQALYKDNDAAPGWDAIDRALEGLYPNQRPKHYGTAIKYLLGGPDPIDGISVYQAGDHIHLVTYGFSSLYYDEESAGAEFSNFGFELTMRLPNDDDPVWAMNMLQNIARYVFKSGKWLEAGHYMPANGPIKQGTDTKLVGLAFGHDVELAAIDTAHGRVEFIQVFGITQTEIDQIKNSDNDAASILEQHRKLNPMLVTVLSRDDI